MEPEIKFQIPSYKVINYVQGIPIHDIWKINQSSMNIYTYT